MAIGHVAVDQGEGGRKLLGQGKVTGVLDVLEYPKWWPAPRECNPKTTWHRHQVVRRDQPRQKPVWQIASAPRGQDFPQVPQLCASDCKSTQAPKQLVRFPGQVMGSGTQTPPWQ